MTTSLPASSISVNFTERIMTVRITPWEQSTRVVVKGQMWTEVFSAAAYAEVPRPGRVIVYREHDRARPVGKAVRLWNGETGFMGEVAISRTQLGDETLQLAADGVLSVSAGFAAASDGIHLDRRTMTRRVNKAHIDHIGLVGDPAYEGAEVLSVRAAGVPTVRPALEAFASDPVLRWAGDRLARKR